MDGHSRTGFGSDGTLVGPRPVAVDAQGAATASRIHTVQCYLRGWQGHGGTVLCAVLLPGSPERVVTGSEDCTARLWRCSDGACLAVFAGFNEALPGDHVTAGWLLTAGWLAGC